MAEKEPEFDGVVSRVTNISAAEGIIYVTVALIVLALVVVTAIEAGV